MIQKRELLHIWKELDINQNKYTMDKEDIEKAAAEYANEACRPLWRTGYEQVCMADFIEGAEWRINSVWHDINEIPEDGRIIVLLGKYGTMIIYGPNMMYYREAVIMDGGFLKWAYKEDLIPNTEGEQ